MTAIDVQLIHETAAKHGVPGSVAEELLVRSRPCVYLVQYEEVPASLRERTRPAARTGGLPALPEGADWPDGREPLILSVDCAALPHEVLDIELPADGHLLFFSDIEYPPDSSAVLHVPAGTPTTEHPGAYEVDGESMEVRVYESRTLYPLVGLTLDDDWRDAPAALAFAQGEGRADVLDRFEEDILEAASGGTRPGVWVQIGGFSNSWDMAPDTDGLVLFAQIAGQAIDYDVYTLNLIVGTREDIAARRYDRLQYEQQC
ncbi:DUF1963 domain-containing protein [Streptomyces chartreusis]|uniref:DUF1963 domain-containing protein n=1 Tax=Streptomyces chartreusis TaxID=1969 RepID=UPI00365F559F